MANQFTTKSHNGLKSKFNGYLWNTYYISNTEFDAGDKVNLCLNLGLEDGSAGKLSFAVQEGGPDPEL